MKILKRRLRAPFRCGSCGSIPCKSMGNAHCGYVTFEADIDPRAVSICHCTDCQTLTGSPFRVTVICSGGAGRVDRRDAESLRRWQRPQALSALLSALRCATFHQRRRRPNRRLGYSLAFNSPARSPQACAADLVPLGGSRILKNCPVARWTNLARQGRVALKSGFKGG